MNGFFLVDKPKGPTSFGVLRDLKKKLGEKKLGHSGTLDPNATGLLLVAAGNYTKLIPYFEKDTKTYEATIMLDGVSPSYDSDTDISYISESKKQEFANSISLQDITKICDAHFLGKISQIPPKYSALKIDGKRALDRTLAGQDIEMKSREVKIFSYTIKKYVYPQLDIELHVSAGTYIRSIAHDLGQLLGTGGYLSELRRTQIGTLNISQSVGLEKIEGSHSLSVEDVFGNTLVFCDDTALYERLSNGQRVRGDFSFPTGKQILLCDGRDIRFVIEYIGGVVHPRKKIV